MDGACPKLGMWNGKEWHVLGVPCEGLGQEWNKPNHSLCLQAKAWAGRRMASPRPSG